MVIMKIAITPNPVTLTVKFLAHREPIRLQRERYGPGKIRADFRVEEHLGMGFGALS